MTEVGVALALRRQRKQLIQEEGGAMQRAVKSDNRDVSAHPKSPALTSFKRETISQAPPSTDEAEVAAETAHIEAAQVERDVHDDESPTTDASNERRRKEEPPHQRQKQTHKAKLVQQGKLKQQRNPSLQIFIDAVTIYAACIYLPSVAEAIMRAYQNSWEDGGMLLRFNQYLCTLSPTLELLMCISQHALVGDGQDSSTAESSPSTLADALAPDVGISDFVFVVLLSVSMAVLRVALVHFLVPRYLEQPQRLEALVRCKSVHLLSASYSGTLTPRQSIVQSRDIKINSDVATLLPPIPILSLLTGVEGSNADQLRLISPRATPDNIPLSPRKESEEELTDYGWLLPGEGAEIEPAPAVSSGLISSTSAQSLQALLEQATPARVTSMAPNELDQPMPQRMDRLFAAPKYATAMFRLLYCSGCVIIGLFYFVNAEFWPPAVGGRGSTKRCWDLSSLGTVIMESDFDKHNTMLRRYFLVQASYHFHSAAFHIVTSILLWTVTSSVKRKSKTKNGHHDSGKSNVLFSVIPSGIVTVQNVQSFFLHCFAVGLLIFAYLFSSLRRLAAIGIFAFDVSSWFLHLLQLCINSPPGTRRVAPTWVWVLHKFLVLPTFVYSRFYVFPFVLGYSSLYESDGWLRQLESVTVPGVAVCMRCSFMIWLSVLMVLNALRCKRLLLHPHVLQALQAKRQKKD